ncbi:Glycosyltransferase involved in cell wall bisynthesis [Oceanobacillus limi]|uniref:Glycosyltransferase involved in cell wall bisynthesis n=1 Tax=Oceanobacillus limi TaxID=930131 RepID=A0A1I0A515_9BACI|nr:glycosyltransferase family 4 protein [Oceanobacillus limi]SES89260.1 Glycosyltransferase involved in cell wall bisynthesis [Oceanobacillus limi]
MKCLIVTTLDRQVLLFLIPHIKLLHGLGNDVSVATSIEDKQQLEKKLPTVSLHHVSFSRSIYDLANLKAFFKIRRLLRTENYNFVHVHTPIAAFITRIAAPKKQQIIYTAHGFHFNENGSAFSNRIFYLAEKIAANKTDKLIVMNQEDFQKAKGFMSEDKIQRIHGIGVDAAYFYQAAYTQDDRDQLKEKLSIPKNKKVITHLAEFNENKRQIDVVDAAEQLKTMYKDFVILLVGDGVLLDDIEREIERRDLTEYVRCLHFRKDIRDILSITDIGLLVSLREGLPKSLMEMMSMKIPIVGTDIRGNRELVEDGKNGFLIPIKSPTELMKALLTLLEKKELCQAMGNNGRREVLEKYDLKRILEEMKKVYPACNGSNTTTSIL